MSQASWGKEKQMLELLLHEKEKEIQQAVSAKVHAEQQLQQMEVNTRLLLIQADEDTKEAVAELEQALKEAVADKEKAAKQANIQVARWQKLAQLSDEWAMCDAPGYVPKNFATTNFNREYKWVGYNKPLKKQQKDRVLFAVRHMVELYCASLHPSGIATGDQKQKGIEFLQQLQGEWDITDDADLAVERVWSSLQILKLAGSDCASGPEFCFIFSQAIREDRASTARACAILARWLKTNLVGTRQGVYPPNGVCWRGGGFDDRHREFFELRARAFAEAPGSIAEKYRVPGFLATSARRAVTNTFMDRAEAAGHTVVQWRIDFDVRGDPQGENLSAYRCKHVNKLRVTHVRGEDEWLFQAYSVFTVKEVKWSEVTPATVQQPHRITLAAAADNASESEELELAPWC